MYKFLNDIEFPSDLRQLSPESLPILAQEARDFILEVLATKPGHLGASLGVMELTIALHYYFDTPQDILVWDVGHQAYGHKLFTGRKNDFETLRQWNGMSGFPVRGESKYDAFGVGHSSTSISAIVGMALANKIQQRNNKHIAVIGDASIVSGMAFEGLNHLGATNLDVLIILNDNNIGIDPAVGALQKHFNALENQSEEAFFRALGLHYHGVIDGHDFTEILNAFESLEKIKKPKLLHIRTIKGKGYEKAEKDQILWHSPGKFDKITGEILPKSEKLTFPKLVGNSLIEIFKKSEKVVTVTPAMPTGSGLVDLMHFFPERVWDVGIAEQHAVTLSAGLATQGLKPFCVIYSTFLQRAYDQVIHDVALQNLPVVFLIDRAGFVGSDGATHHGYFDISFLNSIPHMVVACPADAAEIQDLLQISLQTNQPFAIRYPKIEILEEDLFSQNTVFGKVKNIQKGKKLAVLSTGYIAQTLKPIVQNLNLSWYHFPFVKPLDIVALEEIFNQYSHIITFENGIENGGFGNSILNFANKNNYKGKIEIVAYPDKFVEHGSNRELDAFVGMDSESVKEKIHNLYFDT